MEYVRLVGYICDKCDIVDVARIFAPEYLAKHIAISESPLYVLPP